MKVIAHLKGKKSQFPQKSPKFKSADRYASKIEKKKYPRGFKKLSKITKHLSRDEILGHINRKGKITVSKKVPKKLRKEVALHEKVERRRILGRKK